MVSANWSRVGEKINEWYHLNITDHYDTVIVYEVMRIIQWMQHHLSCHCHKHQRYGHVVVWLDFSLPAHLYSYSVGHLTSFSLFARNGLNLKRIPKQWLATRYFSVSSTFIAIFLAIVCLHCVILNWMKIEIHWWTVKNECPFLRA